MEDLNKLLLLTETFPVELERITEDYLLKLRVILWGQAAVAASHKEKLKDLPAASPQQTKKRVKRLSSLNEDEAEDKLEIVTAVCENVKISSSQENKYSSGEFLASDHVINDENKTEVEETPVAAPRTNCGDSSSSNGGKKEKTTTLEISKKSEATNLMPPPPTPANETLNKRPQRAAKLKSEKCLKEPKLNAKLRRPTNDEIKIKLEHEQRSSQMHESTTINTSTSKHAAFENGSLSSQKSDDSLIAIPEKQPSIVSINSDIEDLSTVASDKREVVNEEGKSVDSTDSGVREIRIKIKREKISVDNKKDNPVAPSDQAVFKVPEALPMPIFLAKTETTVMEDTSLASSILSSTTSATTAVPAKKIRKKKDITHKPIKVERFSDLELKPSPISSRTRNGSLNKSHNEISPTEESKRPASIYEDAVAAMPSRNSKENNATATATSVVNETVNLGPPADVTMDLGPAPSDATFCTNPVHTTFQVASGQTTFVMDSNPNTAVTGTGAPADTILDIHQMSETVQNKENDASAQRSFQTAKDSSMPNNDSLLTEDEQDTPRVTQPKVQSLSVKAKGATKALTSAKATVSKIHTRAHELFNPLAQSPVKLRVEAFENAAAAAATQQYKRPLRSKKENSTPTAITPVIGKLTAPALGRFLTPTQSSNITTASSAFAKKGTTSASKALPMPKSANASSLYRSNSTASSKTLQRENSADEFRKGLNNLAEERKKQREQKHLLAAQQREAKERERAERVAKLAKEREEKRLLKKQQEQEQKKRELEEIQRKLRQQQEEEAAKLKAAREREMLLQMKQQQQLAKQKIMPPPPKLVSKYTFEMLHEDDSTDDEDKVSYKRPPPPSWSRSHVRGPVMLKQEYTPCAYIDSFFSVQPMTPDLKIIFPNIDARYLKRNSSVLWSTPPRYSELPKY